MCRLLFGWLIVFFLGVYVSCGVGIICFELSAVGILGFLVVLGWHFGGFWFVLLVWRYLALRGAVWALLGLVF